MKKLIWLAIFLLSVIMSYSQSYTMRSTSSGISVGLGVGTGGWQCKDFGVTQERGLAYGIQLGYGFNENIELFGKGAFIRINPEDEFFLPFQLNEYMLGARYTFGSTLSPLKFYANASISVLSSSQSVDDSDWFFDETISTYYLRGIGGTVGLGAKYHLRLPIAITLDATMTFGKLNNNYWEDEAIESFQYRSNAIRLGAVIYFNQL
ncbi:MAG: outer membrane beta-barrel protein [Saprospiraceae bacterium]|nr:outer membrane beta-barrel protein [Saprospiraceae bacterium]